MAGSDVTALSLVDHAEAAGIAQGGIHLGLRSQVLSLTTTVKSDRRCRDACRGWRGPPKGSVIPRMAATTATMDDGADHHRRRCNLLGRSGRVRHCVH